MKVSGTIQAICFVAPVIFLSGCSDSNNLLLGHVKGSLGSHRILVTDCYRISVPPPVETEAAGQVTYAFMPCRDAAVVIRSEELFVNGKPYGRLHPQDAVLVDHGVVSIQRQTP